LAAAVRLAAGLYASAGAMREVAAGRRLSNPLYDRVFIASSPEHPQTTGLMRPVVLLPPKACDMETTTLAAVVAHEANHAHWRDPLVGLFLSALAWVWPLPGFIVAAYWRQAAEVAATLAAERRTGCRLSELLPLAPGTEIAKSRPGVGLPAAALASAWAMFVVLLLWLYWHPAVLSIVCAFEAALAAWQ
ncbi:MAG: hypothetical protein H5T86_09465, partial [Armatimonadetes bacterium]|nr:hypothetical protein [Armatimonadota bacterium]